MKATLTEAAFTRMVLTLARLHGWKTMHLRPAHTAKGWRTPVQGDGVGWPDLFLVRGSKALAVELKVGRGKLTDAQRGWITALRSAGIMADVWTPDDWPEIEDILA